VLAQNRLVSAFRVGDRLSSQYWACDRRTRRRVDLGEWESDFSALDHFTVGGRFVAYHLYFNDGRSSSITNFVEVYEPRRGSNSEKSFSLPVDANVADLDLARNGRAAFLVDTPRAGGTRRAVRLGRRVLDTGTSASIGSLRLGQRRVFWLHDGHLRSVSIR